MENKRYMLNKESFMPFIAFALIVGGGVFEGLIRNWDWGILSIPAGIVLLLAALGMAVVTALVAMNMITGEWILLPAGLTAVGMLLHAINMIMIKGSFSYRVELLLLVTFVAMILIMIASLRGNRKNLDHKKTLGISIAIGVVSLLACFIPLIVFGSDPEKGYGNTFMEILETNIPLIMYFAAYICYFAGMKKEELDQ